MPSGVSNLAVPFGRRVESIVVSAVVVVRDTKVYVCVKIP